MTINKSLDNLLKNTLLSLYSDCPTITDALLQCDFSKVNRSFRENLFARIDEEAYWHMDEILHSDEYVAYKNAIDLASLAITDELAGLIEFVVSEGGAKQ